VGTRELHHFRVVCALASDLYRPGYSPGQAPPMDSKIARTVMRCAIDAGKLAAGVRAELLKRKTTRGNRPQSKTSCQRKQKDRRVSPAGRTRGATRVFNATAVFESSTHRAISSASPRTSPPLAPDADATKGLVVGIRDHRQPVIMPAPAICPVVRDPAFGHGRSPMAAPNRSTTSSRRTRLFARFRCGTQPSAWRRP
jgi:hypothetical protein